jgi:hypothetical protein
MQNLNPPPDAQLWLRLRRAMKSAVTSYLRSPKFGIVLVLVVVLVLGALGFRDRKETDGTNLFC